MWKFRSKQAHRDLEILKLFFIYEEKMTINQLADYLKCSAPTVRTRILEINENYDFPKIIYNYDTDSVETSYDPSFWPYKIYRDFYNHNIEFQVLEYLFLQNNVNSYELRDVFGLSESTLFRIIHNLNDNLKKWGIEITGVDYEIVGDELAITKFFTQYFTEKTSVSFFDDFNVFQTAIFNIFMDILESLDEYELRPYFNRFQWYSFVSLIRHSKGYFIPQSDHFNHELLMSRIDLLDQKDLRVIESLFGVSLASTQTVNDVFYVYFNPFKHVKFNKFVYQKSSVDDLLEEIVATFSLTMEESMFLKISDFLYSASNGYFAQSYFLFDRPRYELEKIRKIFPKSISTLEKIVSSFVEKETSVSNDALSIYLILFIMNIFPSFYTAMRAYEDKILVKCFFVANETYTQKIMKFLVDNYSFIAEFKLCDNHTLPDLEDQQDIWIVDVHAVSSDNVLVINSNLISLQATVILDFIEFHRDKKQSIQKDC